MWGIHVVKRPLGVRMIDRRVKRKFVCVQVDKYNVKHCCQVDIVDSCYTCLLGGLWLQGGEKVPEVNVVCFQAQQ